MKLPGTQIGPSRRRGRSVALVAGALVALSIAPTAIGGSGSAIRWVDDDGRAGPNGCGGRAVAATTVQAGVDASDVADTVMVCPGVYVGDVQIIGQSHDGLTVRSVTKGAATLVGTPTTSDLVFIHSAKHVRILGFRLTAPTVAPCAYINAMIYAVGSDGAVIRDNVIRPSGTDTLGDCGFEVGIRILAGSSISVRDNIVHDFAGAGIYANGDPRLQVLGNTIRYHHAAETVPIQPRANGMSIVGAAGLIRGNRLVGLSTAGVTTPVLNAGVLVYGAVTNQMVIRNNVIKRAVFGLAVQFSSGALVVDNTSRFNEALDCWDISTGGTGTAGTDNIWIGNVGDPARSDPAGICSLP